MQRVRQCADRLDATHRRSRKRVGANTSLASSGVMRMSVTASSPQRQRIKRIVELRRHPSIGDPMAVVVVALAALARLAAADHLGGPLPFLTFYPAIIVATLLGGAGPGVLSLLLSAAAANYMFMPPAYAWALGNKDIFALA